MRSHPFARREFLGLVAAGGAAAAGATVWPSLALGKGYMLEVNHQPADLETPLEQLNDAWLTRNEWFFVRSHMGPPRAPIDAAAWRLGVWGTVNAPLQLSLRDLKHGFEQVSVSCVLQCAGNGRSLYTPKVPGAQWRYGAVGNAKWTGVRLADVLKRADLATDAKFLIIRGHDEPVLKTTPKFVRGFPLDKAMDPYTILAYEMNGKPLPELHGAPLRMIVPGWAGDHWMKWLHTVEVRNVGTEDDAGFWTASAYRYPNNPGAPGVAVPLDQTHRLTAINVKSIITNPLDGRRLTSGSLAVEGVAFSGLPTIRSVEVSVDDGAWMSAQLGSEQAPYSWRRFTYRTQLAPGPHTIAARATDETGAVQPETAAWNPSGYINNAIMKVNVNVGAAS